MQFFSNTEEPKFCQVVFISRFRNKYITEPCYFSASSGIQSKLGSLLCIAIDALQIWNGRCHCRTLWSDATPHNEEALHLHNVYTVLLSLNSHRTHISSYRKIGVGGASSGSLYSILGCSSKQLQPLSEKYHSWGLQTEFSRECSGDSDRNQ